MATSCSLLHVSSFPQIPSIRPSSLPSRLQSLRLSPSPVRAAVQSGGGPVEPALRHANVLFFKSGYNVQIVVDEDEPEEALLRRFRREVSRAGVIQEVKRRRFFENKQEEKKRKTREAAKKNRWRRSGPRYMSSPSSPADSVPKNTREDADDNWELPESSLP